MSAAFLFGYRPHFLSGPVDLARLSGGANSVYFGESRDARRTKLHTFIGFGAIDGCHQILVWGHRWPHTVNMYMVWCHRRRDEPILGCFIVFLVLGPGFRGLFWAGFVCKTSLNGSCSARAVWDRIVVRSDLLRPKPAQKHGRGPETSLSNLKPKPQAVYRSEICR